MKVLKFGGTSVGSTESIKKVLEIIRSSSSDERCVIVVSAFTKVTDQLIELAEHAEKKEEYQRMLSDCEVRHLDAVRSLVSIQEQSRVLAQVKQLINELGDVLRGITLVSEVTAKTKDSVMSFGERLSACIIASALESAGVPSLYLDTRTVIKTDDSFGSARVRHNETDSAIQDYTAKNNSVIVATGFIGSTENGETTTLGRGGSDYTASLFGAALNASVIEIWTDVDGVLTADPRTITGVQIVSQMTYEEAMELSYFGAKVIYYPTMRPALGKNIPILIKNTFNPKAAGTRICATENPLNFPVTSITSVSNCALVRIEGIGFVGVAGMAHRVFHALGGASINVILISQASSQYSICIAIDSEVKEKAWQVLHAEFALEIAEKKIEPVIIEHATAIIAVVGAHMRHTPGVAGRIFSAVGSAGINITALVQGSSELNISLAVEDSDKDRAIQAIHDEFFPPSHEASARQVTLSKKTINVFLVGAGLIGSTLLKQMKEQTQTLFDRYGIDIRLVGIANADHMFLDYCGIPFDSATTDLAEKGSTLNMDTFVQQINDAKLSFPVFVDCTASEDIAQCYEKIIDAGVAIVTPNKKANSGSTVAYEQLHAKVHEKNVPFFYETNVGAALPIISTLQDLIKTGDRVKKIEAVLSGTLSYIFNTFSSSERSFSDIVREAKEMGYTEPDPRDDLSGADVARKIVILAREMGEKIEINDVTRVPIIPADCFDAHSVDEFFAVLQKYDSDFDTQRSQAQSKGCVLRVIASIDEGGARMKLEEVDAHHPFYSLSGSDNIISFTTQRYCDTPLVIKGPGAGAQVTAGGVFADILRTVRSL